jgi:hypothetical protein
MNKIIFAAIVAAGFAAQAITLGELTGKGTLDVETKIEGKTSAYTSSCDLAMNVTLTETQFSLDYTLFMCTGTNVWNDTPYSFDIVNGELMSGGKSYGKTDGDSAMFLISWQTQEKHSEVIYDENCVARDIKYHNFKLDHNVGYKLAKVGNGYSVDRFQETDGVTYVYRKPSSNCSAVAVPVKSKTLTQVLGQVSK